jgi:hypothetical protein
METIESLKQRLKSERELSQKITESTRSTRLAVDDAEGKLQRAIHSVETEQTEAVLQQRKPSLRSLQAAVDSARADAETRRAELKAVLSADVIQRMRVGEAEGAIIQRENEILRAALEPARQVLFDALGQMIAAGAVVDAALEKSGPADLTALWFAVKPAADGWSDYQKQAMVNTLVTMLNGALKASRMNIEYDTAAEIVTV